MANKISFSLSFPTMIINFLIFHQRKLVGQMTDNPTHPHVMCGRKPVEISPLIVYFIIYFHQTSKVGQKREKKTTSIYCF